MYYKALGKKIVFTAHNVNAAKRDSSDNWHNRFTLRVQYRLCDHIFVHTERMKQELLQDFAVSADKTSVIPFGINNSVPNTALTAAEAKQRLGLRPDEKAVLFFGNIGPYKGLEFLVEAFQSVAANDPCYRLIIAGKPRGGCEPYLRQIQENIRRHSSGDRILQKIEYVPDQDTELYFKAADVLALPYKEIFQSGVLFLGYSFGLPIIATDIGSLREDIIEGRTGMVCKQCDSADLARVISKYFESDLFIKLVDRRPEISEYATARHSWNTVGDITRQVYEELSLG
jgi:glycosyltransferase involved in cell wall biosynthesis